MLDQKFLTINSQSNFTLFSKDDILILWYPRIAHEDRCHKGSTQNKKVQSTDCASKEIKTIHHKAFCTFIFANDKGHTVICTHAALS